MDSDLLEDLFLKAMAPQEGPSPYQSLFLMEQDCHEAIRGKVLHRTFILGESRGRAPGAAQGNAPALTVN